jgi:hypothetical protein
MTNAAWRLGVLVLGVVAVVVLGVAERQLPAAAANGLLHPVRRRVSAMPPSACQNEVFNGNGVDLKGWRCQASALRRGTLIYLHGIADNRSSAVGVIERFGKRGLDVVAYDSRAHGESAGSVCTYGFNEKRDLHAVVDTVGPGPVILVGTSLGAAVALQEAATDRRVTAVVAVETFSDLRSVAIERAPFFFTTGLIDQAFRMAEQQGGFHVDSVSPLTAAAQISVPVLLVHGAVDTDTPPDHSRRVLAALAGPKRLILVPSAGHNQSLRAEVWDEIEEWIDDVLTRRANIALEPTARPGVFVRVALRLSAQR